jgi:hypothetical protein
MTTLLWLLLLALLFETAPDDDEETDDDDEPEAEPEPVRDPEKKALSREAGRWRTKYREAETKIKEMESGAAFAEPLRASRLESAFLRVVLARGGRLDVETSWDLLRVRGFADTVTIDDDGDVKGMDEALGRLLDRYPWLEEPASDPNEDRPLRRTAPAPKKRKDGAAEQHSKASLEARFPALRRHSR